MIEGYSFLYIFLLFPIVSWGVLKYLELEDKRYYALLNFLLLSLTLGFRDIDMGTDTRAYLGAFEYNANVEISSWTVGSFEWGYVILNKILYFMGFPAQSILVVMSVFTIGIMIYVYYYYSDKMWLAIYLFIGLGLYTYSFNIIRQTLAAAIVMLAVCLLSDGKKLWFIFLVFTGAAFHQSVILFLPIVFLYNLTKWCIVGYIITCVSAVLSIYVSGLDNYLFLVENSKYIAYLGGQRLGEVSFGFGLVKVAFSVICGCIGIGMYYRNGQNNKLLIFSSLLVITAGTFDLMAYHIALLGRFSYNYLIYTTILIPQLLKYSNLYKNIFFIYFFLIGVFLWFSKYLMVIEHYI